MGPNLTTTNQNQSQDFSKTGDRDDDKFLYVGQAHDTFGKLLSPLGMVTSEIWFVLKYQAQIKMRVDPV